MSTAVKAANDAENDDAECRDDRAVYSRARSQLVLCPVGLRPPVFDGARLGDGSAREDVPGPSLHGADERLHDGRRCVFSWERGFECECVVECRTILMRWLFGVTVMLDALTSGDAFGSCAIGRLADA